MNTQTKKFSLKLIEELIELDQIIDTSVPNLTKDNFAIARHNCDIEQPIIYAIEHNEYLELLQNDVIQPLIEELHKMRNVNVKMHRKLLLTTLQICILSPLAPIEDAQLFRKIIL